MSSVMDLDDATYRLHRDEDRAVAQLLDDLYQHNPIQIRSLFTGWHAVTPAEALAWARWLFRAITTMPDEAARVAHINTKLRGVQFTLAELTAVEQ